MHWTTLIRADPITEGVGSLLGRARRKVLMAVKPSDAGESRGQIAPRERARGEHGKMPVFI